MSAFLDWIAAIGGALIVWTALGTPVAFVLGRVTRFRNRQKPADIAATPTPEAGDPDATADDFDDDALASPSALCEDCMLRREFVSIISSTWEWSA